MAEQACNVIKQGGSSVKIYDLGTGTSFNVKNIEGWENFTVYNFLSYPTGPNGNSFVAGDISGNRQAGAGLNMNVSYNNGIYAIKVNLSGWWTADEDGHQHYVTKHYDGNYVQWHTYLVTDLSKVKKNQ
jgi:hypothetical protein